MPSVSSGPSSSFVFPPTSARLPTSLEFQTTEKPQTRVSLDTSFGALLRAYSEGDYDKYCITISTVTDPVNKVVLSRKFLSSFPIDLITRVHTQLGDTAYQSITDAYVSHPEPFDLYTARFLHSSTGVSVSEFADRIVSAVSFLRSKVGPSKRQHFLLHGKGSTLSRRFDKVTFDSTPRHVLDMDDLGYVYTVYKGSGQRHFSPSYFIPYSQDTRRLRWHMREADRSLKTGLAHRHYIHSIAVENYGSKPALERDEILSSLAHGADNALTQLFTELGLEHELQGGLPSRLFMGYKNHAHLGETLEHTSNITGGISTAVSVVGQAFKNPIQTISRLSGKIKKLLRTGHSMSTLLVACIAIGVLYELLTSAVSFGCASVRRLVRIVLTTLMPAKEAAVVIATCDEETFEAQSGSGGNVSAVNVSSHVLRAFFSFKALRKFEFSQESVLRVATDFDSAFRSGSLEGVKTFDSARSFLSLFEIASNAVLSVFTDRRLSLSNKLKTRLDHVKETATRLYPLKMTGKLPLYEPDKSINIQDAVVALEVLMEMQLSGRFTDNRVRSEVDHAMRCIREVLSFYNVDSATPQKARVHPVAILIKGKPGQGKSLLMPVMSKAVLWNGLRDGPLRNHFRTLGDDKLIFQKSSSEYWEGEVGQPIYAFDDWMAEVDDCGKDSDASLYLRLCNGWHMPLNMAQAEMKGKKYAHPYIVAATTNMERLADVQGSIRHTEALSRRMDVCFELEVAPAYRIGGAHCMSKMAGNNEVLDSDLYHAAVLEHRTRGAYPWHIHQARLVTYTATDCIPGALMTLPDVINLAAAKLRSNVDIHTTGGFEVPMDCLDIPPPVPHIQPHNWLPDVKEDPDELHVQGGFGPGTRVPILRKRAEKQGSTVTTSKDRLDQVHVRAGNTGLVTGMADYMVDQKQYAEDMKKLAFNTTYAKISSREVGNLKYHQYLEKTIGMLEGSRYVAVRLHDVADAAQSDGDAGTAHETVTGQSAATFGVSKGDLEIMKRPQAWLSVRPIGGPTADLISARVAGLPAGMTLNSACNKAFGTSIGELIVIYCMVRFIGIPVIRGLCGLSRKAIMAPINKVRHKVTSDPDAEHVEQGGASPLQTVPSTVRRVARISVNVYVKDGDSWQLCGHGLRVAGRALLVQRHVIGCEGDLKLTNTLDASDVHKFSVVVERSTFNSLPQAQSKCHADLMMVVIPSFPEDSKHVFGLFPESSTYKSFCGGPVVHVSVDSNGINKTLSHDVRYLERTAVTMSEQKVVYNDCYNFRGVLTSKGDCGSMYVGLDHGTSCVFAMHAAGSKNATTVGLRMHRSDIQEMYNKLDCPIPAPVTSEVDSLDADGEYEIQGFCSVGSCSSSEASCFNPVSALRPSKIIEQVASHMGVDPDYYDIAHLRPFKKDDTTVYPMQRAVGRYLGDPMVFNAVKIKRAVNTALFPMASHKGLKAFTYKESVAGVPFILKSISRSKSNGYPKLKYSRKQIFGTDEFVFDTPGAIEMEASVMDYLNRCNAGERPKVVFADFPKDELLKQSKVESGDTRLISPSPTFFYLAFRMLFGPFLAKVEDRMNRLNNGIAIGSNPYTDWDDMYRHLTQYNCDGFAGDFKTFDASQQRQILEAIWVAVCGFFDDEWNTARLMMGLELTDSIHLVNLKGRPATAFYAWVMSLPSGHPGTAVFNSLYNLVLFVLCYADITGKAMETFWEKVRIIVLGDDNIVAPKPEIAAVFNLVSVAEAMKRYGMTYTDADKTGVLVPTTPIVNCSFLKRTFRLVAGSYRGPIAPLSLYKMCSHVRIAKKSGLSEAMLQQENLDTLMRELSLHGEEYFASHAGPLATIFHDAYGITPRVGTDFSVVLSSVADAAPQWLSLIQETT